MTALSQIYPRYSLKRRIAFWANALNILILNRAPSAVAKIQKVLPNLSTGSPNNYWAVLFHKIAQNGRVYAFEFSNSGVLQVVSKIGLTDTACIGIARERAVLQQLSHIELPFHIPKVVDTYDERVSCVLSITAIDHALKIHNKAQNLPEWVYDAIASLRPVDAPTKQPCSAFEWFEATSSRISNPAIRDVVKTIQPNNPFVVSAAHRDLGSENVFSRADTLSGNPTIAIIDWEFFTETAPAMTDRVGFWLGQHHRQFKRALGVKDRTDLTEDFFETFRETKGGVTAASLALVGLLSIGNDLAERLCDATE